MNGNGSLSGVRTRYQAVGVDRNGTSSIFGRGGCGVCSELRLKGRSGRPDTASQLPGHQVALGGHFLIQRQRVELNDHKRF